MYILIPCAVVVLLMIGMFLWSKSYDPEEKRKEEEANETSERILMEHKYFWKKEASR